MSQFSFPRIGSIGTRLAIRGRPGFAVPSRDERCPAVFAGMADACAKILAEAHRFVRIGLLGSPLNQLVFGACEVLDDMDEVLVALHPARNGGEFATAAALHRELEQIQAAIPVRNRDRMSASPSHEGQGADPQSTRLSPDRLSSRQAHDVVRHRDHKRLTRL